jgi:hypothetical protein
MKVLRLKGWSFINRPREMNLENVNMRCMRQFKLVSPRSPLNPFGGLHFSLQPSNTTEKKTYQDYPSIISSLDTSPEGHPKGTTEKEKKKGNKLSIQTREYNGVEAYKYRRMPKIRTNRTKPPPEGFEEIEGVLDEYERKMRDGKRYLDSCNIYTFSPPQEKRKKLKAKLGTMMIG